MGGTFVLLCYFRPVTFPMLSMSMSFALPCPCLLRAFFEYDACDPPPEKYAIEKFVFLI